MKDIDQLISDLRLVGKLSHSAITHNQRQVTHLCYPRSQKTLCGLCCKTLTSIDVVGSEICANCERVAKKLQASANNK